MEDIYINAILFAFPKDNVSVACPCTQREDTIQGLTVDTYFKTFSFSLFFS